MTYGIPALDAVRKISNEAWLFLAKPLDFLHLCMGGDIHKINKNLILLCVRLKQPILENC
jgi:hypothetical protein